MGPSGEALLDYNIYDAMRAGFTKAALVIRQAMEADFRAHVERYFGRSLQVSFVLQELDVLPPGYTVPAGRSRPWGTGHALLVASREMTGPFAVCNADDFYGEASFVQLREHFRETAGRDGAYALIGYRLDDTVPATGGVSRGVCEIDASGYLERVVEVKKITRERDRMVGVTPGGAVYTLTGSETTATGLFGLTPAVTTSLEREFALFLDEQPTDTDAEFLIGTPINREIAAGRASVRVIPTREPWIGITHPEDRDAATRGISELVAAGRYPDNLARALMPGAN